MRFRETLTFERNTLGRRPDGIKFQKLQGALGTKQFSCTQLQNNLPHQYIIGNLDHVTLRGKMTVDTRGKLALNRHTSFIRGWYDKQSIQIEAQGTKERITR